MDRNSIIGIIIIAGILIFWGTLNKPSEEEMEQARRRGDSLEIVEQVERERQIREQLEAGEGEVETTDDVAKETDSVSDDELRSTLGQFAAAGKGQEEFYTIENELLKLTISTKGGKPYSVEIKEYKTYDSLPLVLFTGDSVIFGLNFFSQNRTISTNELYFKPSVDMKTIVADNSEKTLTMRMEAEGGGSIEYRYSVQPGSYMVDFDIVLEGMESITNNYNTIDLEWELNSPQLEKEAKNENYYTTIYFKPYQEDADYFNARSNKQVQEEEITTQVEWIAFKDQFFSSVLIADKTFSNAFVKYTDLPESEKYLKNFRAEIGLPLDRNAYTSNIGLRFYFGPNKYSLLKKKYSDLQLHDLVTVGKWIIKWINQLIIIPIFDLLNGFISNYGIIILLLTLIIKMGLLPLTYRSYISQAKMRVLKPQIDEINKKIPKEKSMERQQATMALYKKAGVSPMGGCLPMLLQMPILFAMFRFFPTSIELRQESFLWADDLSTYDAIIEWSEQIPVISNLYGNHVSLFTLLMTLSTILTMKLNNQATASTQQMPGMKGMMYIMPVMFMFILNRFSAGLTYYYFLANIITFGQNLLFKQFVDEDELLKKMQSKKTRQKKKSSFQARMEKMARERGYNTPKKR